MVKSKIKFPKEGNFVIAKVVDIQRGYIYVDLLDFEGREDENLARGMIHISEISSRWIRNVRNYVRMNEILVLKVLKVDNLKGHVDLSLRRVTAQQKQLRMKEWKYAFKFENLLTFLADETGKSINELYETIGFPILDSYKSYQKTLEDIKENGIQSIENLDIEQEIAKKFVEIIEENVIVSTVSISGKLSLTSTAPNGINLIKNAIKAGITVIKSPKETKRVDIRYVAAPNYRLEVIEKNYQEAESVLASVLKTIEDEMINVGGTLEFIRDK